METSTRPEPVPDWAPRGPSQKPLFRLIAAFGLSIPLVAVSLLEASARPQLSALWSAASWLVCGLLASWNAIEYGLGRGSHGGETPAWLRWVLAVPYLAVTWVGVRTVAAMVAGLAYLAAAGS